jgi:prepilin-type N-terminal cleavage/methylation domain-containing protein
MTPKRKTAPVDHPVVADPRVNKATPKQEVAAMMATKAAMTGMMTAIAAVAVTATTGAMTIENVERTSEKKSGVNPERGFTLLEMLVALSVLTMVVLLLFQTIGATSSSSAMMKRRLDMDAEARSIFDRMDADITSMVIRQDVDTLFLGLPQDGSGVDDHNDQFYFYSQGPGYSTSTAGLSPLSMIGFAVTNQQLARMAMKKGWDDLPFLTTNVNVTGFNTTNLSQCLGSATNYWHVVGPSVFRMEIGLMMKPGTVNSDGSTNLANSYAYLGNPAKPRHGLANVAAVVVAMGLLDPSSRATLPSSQLSNLGSLLQDCMSNGGIPLNAWETNLTVSNGLPPILANRVRLYIRTFPLKR